MSFILSIDQGTTSSRCIVFDKAGKIVASHAIEHKQIRTKAAYVEHDPLEIYKNVEVCIRTVLASAKLTAADIASVGITNQRETVVMWDTETGGSDTAACDAASTQQPTIALKSKGRRNSQPKSGADSVSSAPAHNLVYNAIVWQDQRGAPLCDRLSKEGGLGKDRFRDVTGWSLHWYLLILIPLHY
jgi:glycerol kinase